MGSLNPLGAALRWWALPLVDSALPVALDCPPHPIQVRHCFAVVGVTQSTRRYLSIYLARRHLGQARRCPDRLKTVQPFAVPCNPSWVRQMAHGSFVITT